MDSAQFWSFICPSFNGFPALLYLASIGCWQDTSLTDVLTHVHTGQRGSVLLMVLLVWEGAPTPWILVLILKNSLYKVLHDFLRLGHERAVQLHGWV